MGVNEEKGAVDLHVESNFESLKKRAEYTNENKIDLSKRSYFKVMDSLNSKIIEASRKIDHELEYIYLFRYMQVSLKMASIPDTNNKTKVNKDDLKKYASYSRKHMTRLEKLETILKERYKELSLKKSLEEPVQRLKDSMESDDRIIVPSKFADSQEDKKEVMKCTQLFTLMTKEYKEKKPSLLLIDCRSAVDFKGSHIIYDDSISIPKTEIQRGRSAALLQYGIETKYKNKWNRRHSYDIVLLMDRDWSKDKPKDSLLHILILKEILINWDVKGTYNCLLMLEGGFEEFHNMYPQLTTNPKYKSSVQHKTNNILNSFDYPEVPEIVPPKPPETTKKSTPTINRSIKPKAGYAALKEFKEKELTREAMEYSSSDGKDRGEPGKQSQVEAAQVTFPSLLPVSSSFDTQIEDDNESMLMDVDKGVSDPSTCESSAMDISPSPVKIHIPPDEKEEMSGDKMKSILKSSDTRMNDKEKAAYIESLRKVKPKSSETSAQPMGMSSMEDYSSSSDEEEHVMLKKDGVGTTSNMKRSLSSPNIAKAKDDDIMSTPSFSRSNKPNYSARPQPSPFIFGENIDAVYGKTQVGLTGLKNFANNCYMNSILQCLSNTEPLVRELIDLNKPALNHNSFTKGQVANLFITALRCIWSGEIKVYSIRDLKNLMGNYKEIFKGSGHQDSHEFLIILLEYLHDDLNIPSDMSNLMGANESTGEKAWGEFRKKNQSIVQHLFYGQEQSSVTCKTCSHKSLTFDHFFNLSVPIPDCERTSLQECIQVYLSGENIVWTCPKCKVDRNSVKKLDITRLPPILIIALKRFSQEGQSSWLEKKETLVTYPLDGLDMRSFTLPGSEQRHVKYNLHALSTHTGTLRAGHYRAICQNHLTAKWYLFDDSSIHSISAQEVRNNPEVYILFYHAVK